jgi:hypothetical protein
MKGIRRSNGIPTGCPVMPRGDAARGDGRLPVAGVAKALGATVTAVREWLR